MFNILLVDDEKKITEVVKAYLDKEGYNVSVAHDGNEALNLFNNNEFDLVILDRMLPDISGEEICEKIRETSLVHIIMLTAKTEDEDKIDGFNVGCDDYICKPLLFVNNQKKIFTREELLELVTDDYYEKFDRIIDAHIKYLRQKIEEDTRKPRIIQTVYGVGYKFGI